MPIMGINNSDLPSAERLDTGLGDALFTSTQQKLLALLFGQPERSFFANELIKLSASGSGAVQRELKRLTESGLVNSKRIGNQRHFQANSESPIFEELRQIVRKTFGLAEPIRHALISFGTSIEYAFLFGSVAKSTDSAASDIDLFIVSKTLTYPDLMTQLMEAEVQLGRTINTTIYTPHDLKRRIKEKNSFVARVLEQPKIWIIGTNLGLGA